MTSAMLDGKVVDAAGIDPARHVFVGTFRAAKAPAADGSICPCGRHLANVGDSFPHWRDGHFDLPAYRTADAAYSTGWRRAGGPEPPHGHHVLACWDNPMLPMVAAARYGDGWQVLGGSLLLGAPDWWRPLPDRPDGKA